MLQSLYVKNLALIEECRLDFGEGLNILTGETGAGKSLLIGSLNLALGAKFEKEMLRKGAESAYVELTFSGNGKANSKLLSMELEQAEDGSITISRRMQIGKSVCRINGEVVNAKQVRELSETLIDIHGQHEHQSLLKKSRQLEILDSFCGNELTEPASKVKAAYDKCRELKALLAKETLDEQSKAKEQSLAEFELNEIEEARLVIGEDEALEKRYHLMINAKKIREGISESYRFTANSMEDSAGNALSRALRALTAVASYDEKLSELVLQLMEIDSLLSDYNRDIADFMEECEFDEEEFQQVEERLNLINKLKGKYGHSIEKILEYAKERQALLQKLSDYDAYLSKLQKDLEKAKQELNVSCQALTGIRKQNAVILAQNLREALENLNFLSVTFEVHVNPLEFPTDKGQDDVEFMISTNPGEEVKSLSQVASGGELSRIMLALKTLFAGKDDIDTLIFDEIDAGISGITAWKVSKQMYKLAGAHQVICITHLPQIAAMADSHYVIAKSSTDNQTITDIKELTEAESLGELARLLGSDTLSEAAMDNAREMRGQALEFKKQ